MSTFELRSTISGTLSARRAQLSPVFRFPGWLQPAVGPGLLLLVWWCVHVTGLVTGKLLPSPIATVQSLAANLWAEGLFFDLLQTILRTLEAFAIALIIGLPCGIVIGSSRRIYRQIEFLVDFFRSTPATALFPLFMIIFGLGNFSKIAVSAFSAFLIILFNVAYGVMNARPTRMLAARVMGASGFRIFCDVTFYESLPQTFVGIRTAVSLALVVIIVAEMFIGSDTGLWEAHYRLADHVRHAAALRDDSAHWCSWVRPKPHVPELGDPPRPLVWPLIGDGE